MAAHGKSALEQRGGYAPWVGVDIGKTNRGGTNRLGSFGSHQCLEVKKRKEKPSQKKGRGKEHSETLGFFEAKTRPSLNDY